MRFISYEGVAHTLAGSVEVAEKGPGGSEAGMPATLSEGCGWHAGRLTEAIVSVGRDSGAQRSIGDGQP